MDLQFSDAGRVATGLKKYFLILGIGVKGHRYVAKPIAGENLKACTVAIDRQSKLPVAKRCPGSLSVDGDLLLV